jgi:hypothetical protein
VHPSQVPLVSDAPTHPIQWFMCVRVCVCGGGGCCIKTTFGATAQYAFCDFAAALCIQAKCPS